MEFELMGFGVGLAYGFGTSITGIIKNKPATDSKGKSTWKGIEWRKALPTLCITTLAGGLVGAYGMELTDANMATIITGLTSVGVNEWVSNVLKGIYKWWDSKNE